MKKKTVAQKSKRITELDLLFQRLYEDNVASKISAEGFLKLSSDYETEQATLKQELEKLSSEVDEEKRAAVNINRFIAIVKATPKLRSYRPQSCMISLRKSLFTHQTSPAANGNEQ